MGVDENLLIIFKIISQLFTIVIISIMSLIIESVAIGNVVCCHVTKQ